jgi:hypothetical protein
MLEFTRSIALNISKISWTRDMEPRIAELEEDVKNRRRVGKPAFETLQKKTWSRSRRMIISYRLFS